MEHLHLEPSQSHHFLEAWTARNGSWSHGIYFVLNKEEAISEWSSNRGERCMRLVEWLDTPELSYLSDDGDSLFIKAY